MRKDIPGDIVPTLFISSAGKGAADITKVSPWNEGEWIMSKEQRMRVAIEPYYLDMAESESSMLRRFRVYRYEYDPIKHAQWVLSLDPDSLTVDKLKRYTDFDLQAAREWANIVLSSGHVPPFPRANAHHTRGDDPNSL